MKTKLLFCLFLFNFSIFTHAQSDMGLEKGTIITDLYIGGPNLWKPAIRLFTDEVIGDTIDITVDGFGPVGIRGNYLINDKIGFGLDLIYTTASATENSTDFSASLTIIRVIPSFEYHMTLNQSTEAYIQGGLGISSYNFKTSVIGKSLGGPGFVALRLGAGVRYFITDNIGLQGALGLGGPLWSGGLALKF